MPGPYALTSLAAAKTYLRIPAADTSEDAFLGTLVDSATARIEGWTRRLLVARNYDEMFDGTGGPTLTLRQFPTNSVTELNIDGQRKFLTATIIGSDFYVVSSPEGRITLLGAEYGVGGFPLGARIVRVKYNAGYASIPDDLALAAQKLVAQEFRRSRQGVDGVASEGFGGYSVSWSDGLSKDIEQILQRYLRGV